MALLPGGRVAAQQSGQPTTASGSSQTQQPTPVDPPLVSAVVQTPTVKVTKPKLDEYKGHVLVFNIAEVIVQSETNAKFIWSFQYSPEMRTKVSGMLNNGGYRYGDRIRVYCAPGTMVAVKFKGKPSGSPSS